MQDYPTFGAFSNQGLCHLCSVANTTEKFSETKFRKKNSIFGLWKNTYNTIFIYGKMFIIEISYNVLYVWHCMELYDKKFFINGNCMIRSFGQPGPLARPKHSSSSIEHTQNIRRVRSSTLESYLEHGQKIPFVQW